MPVSSSSEIDLRARTLLCLLPPLVHRMNNALAVVQGVHELGARALPGERRHAEEGLVFLRQVLARLALLARAPEQPSDLVVPRDLFATHALILGPLAESLGVALEVRAEATPAVSADGCFRELLLAACVALLPASRPAARGRLSLRARATAAGVRLTLAASGATRPSEGLLALEAHALERGWPVALRPTSGARALRLVLPVAGAACAASEPAEPRRTLRVLLLHGGELERGLVATVLREQGCIVSEERGEPGPGSCAGGFDLALVERRLTVEDAGLTARVRARFAPTRIELLEPRMRPGAVLELLRP